MRKICPNCGLELPEEAMFCFKCGTKIEEEESVPEEIGAPELTEEETGEYESPTTEFGIPETEKAEQGTEIPDAEAVEAEAAEVEVIEPDETGNEKTEETFWKNLPEPAAKTPFHKPKMSKKKKILFGIIAAVIIIFALYAATRPNIVSIEAAYDGDTEEGVVLNESNDGIKVTGTDENGELYDISGWTVKEPETLKANGESTIEIEYKELSDMITVKCSTYTIESVDVSYNGDTEEGTVLDQENTGIAVTGTTPNGEEINLEAGEWTIDTPVTLEADKTSTVTVKYDGQEYPLDVKCSTTNLKSISAKYDGKTGKGTVLNEDNDGIHVYAHYYNGDKEEVDDWEVKKSVKLKAGETAKVTIKYGGMKCTLKVKCTSMTKQQYKDKCKEISYDKLARNPDDYESEMVKFTGKIVQVLEEGNEVNLRINVTNDGYGYYDDTVYVYYSYSDGESRLLEDDIVTFYGLYSGLYTYETVMGASVTIPSVMALYIDN